MGKPSSTHTSRNSSSVSLKATMSKEKTIDKIVKREHVRKRYLKTQRSIQKLFTRLRDNSQDQVCCHSSQASLENSTIDLDDSSSTITPELRTINEVSIVIPDDDQKACSTPKKPIIHTSTPNRSSKKLDDLILAHSNNNLRNSVDRNSYQTIDLTGFNNSSTAEPTIIDLVNTTDDVTLVSVSNENSISGDSEVTVLEPMSRRLKKYTNGIQNLNAAEKARLLEMITQTIFNGCNVPSNTQAAPNVQTAIPRAPDTEEDTYIKEVIIGCKASRSSIGSNVYHPYKLRKQTGKRMVVIDGSNVAMEHGRGQYFSVRGLQICIDYFLRRGHVVKAFVPRFRCKAGRCSDPGLLDFLERKGFVIYTPSREVKGKTITPYDDRYILQCAAEFEGVIVSGDNYRDIMNENARWRAAVEARLLPFTWVGNMIMFPRDPLGRDGPTLEQFLNH